MLYCYHISPIDFWRGAHTTKELIELLSDEWTDMPTLLSIIYSLSRLEDDAKRGFKKIGWEGDVREGPYYFAIPGDTEMSFGYMLKQDNNGSTFVASPEELPWLEKLSMLDSTTVEQTDTRL